MDQGTLKGFFLMKKSNKISKKYSNGSLHFIILYLIF